MSAFQAVYTNFKTIPSRGIVQVVLEAPIESGNHIISLLGMPSPQESKWIGCALMNSPVVGVASQAAAAPLPVGKNVSPTENKIQQVTPTNGSGDVYKTSSGPEWDVMPYSKRAGILSSSKNFWEYADVSSTAEAADYIRTWCNVESRSDIKVCSDSGDRFERLMEFYNTWRRYGEA